MKGTVDPPSSRSTAALICHAFTPSSEAIWAAIWFAGSPAVPWASGACAGLEAGAGAGTDGCCGSWVTRTFCPTQHSDGSCRAQIARSRQEKRDYARPGLSDVVTVGSGSHRLRRRAMQELLIILQDGFNEDEVAITVNGKEARYDRDVTTRELLGMAEEVSVELPAKGATVGVEVTSRNLSAEMKLHGRPKSLLVSIEDGELVLNEGTGREAFL